jgi:hypothetical protein
LLSDYQPHNPNILSIIDNFSYSNGKETLYLESATADYSVIGQVEPNITLKAYYTLTTNIDAVGMQ